MFNQNQSSVSGGQHFSIKRQALKRKEGGFEFEDKPHDKCGIFGVFVPGEEVSRLTFFGLLSLQHRGQESAGIAVSDGKKIVFYRGMGLVNQVFTERRIRNLKGDLAVGHTRYSTGGVSSLKNAQPTVLDSQFGSLALAHNGNLANFKELKERLLAQGHCFNSDVDAELMGRLIVVAKGRDLKEKIINGLAPVKGAFSLLILNKDVLYVVRDRWGIRPLILGRINNEGWLVASESTAIESVGGRVIREAKPGEFIEISKKGLKTFFRLKSSQTGFCIFEYIYFSRPDSVINHKLVH